MIRIFENPVNKSREKIDVDTSVCVFFFGPLYLAFKGLWGHVVLWLVIALPLPLLFDPVGFFFSIPFAAIVYATSIQSILIKRCVRRGWGEVTKKISTPYEILQAKLYVDSINSTYTNINTQQVLPTTKICQFCTEEVPIEAVKCDHCHADLSVSTTNV